MSTARRVTALALAGAAAPLFAGGCVFSAPDCELCPPPGADVCEPAAGQGPPPDACGTFVSQSLGTDVAKGSKSDPLRSLAGALAKTQPGGRVYACGERFDEAVIVPAGVRLFGGLDCARGFWYAPDGRTEIAAPAGWVPITLAHGTEETRVVDVRAVASAGPSAGASAIAAIANHAVAVLVRTSLVAGDASDGEPGAPFDVAAPSGTDGLPGEDGCTDNDVPGGAASITTCADGAFRGGQGGDGGPFLGEDGTDGEPLLAPNHGRGEPANDPGVACTTGTIGASGDAGGPGEDAWSTGLITTSGFTGADGGAGTPGTAAQGGGGGGGAKGGAVCGVKMGGASGGSGGGGGCGGAGGRGGKAGGASIALVSIDSRISFEHAALVAGHGGRGGDGGPGQLGGPGGKGGAGGKAGQPVWQFPACDGGPGGPGGPGGRGGGGAGGHSLGVAFSGNPVAIDGASVSFLDAGPGGAGGIASDHGRQGIAAATLELP